VHLLVRDYQLAWLGTNIHFLFGLLGFGALVGLRPLLAYGFTTTGTLAVLWTAGLLFFSCSIMSRGHRHR